VSAHVFVDESKQRGYLLVASVVVPSDLDSVRRVLRGLVLPGQRRPHMKDESESRKRSIATAITVSGVTATIYDAGRRYRDERERRAACLHALVLDAARRGDAMLVLEQDDTLAQLRTTSGSSSSPGRPAAATPCATNTGERRANGCSPPRMRWRGAGPRAATGADASNPSSPTCERSDRPQKARSPSATVVRPGLGLTS